MKEYFDLLIIAPLEEEAEAVFASFPPVEKRTKNGVLRYVVDTGVPGITAIMAQLPEWGNLEAYKQTDELLREFDAGAVICIGIAGRLSTDLKLGDVCYTGEVFDVSERSKVKNAKGKGRGIEVAFSIKAYSTDKSLTSAINHSRTDPHMKAAVYVPWQYDRGSQLTNLLDESKIEEKYRSDFRIAPIATNGFLVCGAVSSSSNYNDTVRGVDRKVSAIETESGGIFRAAQEHRISALTVRGISDYADSNKNKLEASTKNVARIIAGQNAATFFKAQIHNEEFIEYLGKARRLRTGTPGADLLTPLNPPKLVPLSMRIANAEVESKLKELCPEYPLAQRGYRLPCPRLKPLGLEDDPRQKRKNFTDIQDAVTSNPVVFADVPLNYPDLALPWVWADNLGTSIVLERQVIPIVLDANLIKPPMGELEAAASHFDLAALYNDPSAQVVFILYNVQPDSKSRGNFLAAEMEKHSKARFVLITRGEGKLLLQKELVKRTKGKTYSLCEVSFLAISEFIQASFELAATEAEVIALKLKKTFEKFNLSAHPTYFAGIPRNMLAGLLLANRRAELIQLAVDGYLTLIATVDEEKAYLNRTTRASFLSRLAVELEVEKRTFSQADLIKFTEEFSKEFDFDDLQPLPFINSFVQKGILVFEESGVQFTLPFVKSYLLAVALKEDAQLATRHFAFEDDDFDFETFDLYCELGPCQTIVNSIEERLGADIGALSSSEKRDAFLFSSELRPSILKNSNRLGDIRTGIERTIARLQGQNNDGDGKQRLLDIADNANAQAEKQAGDEAADSASDQSKVSRSTVDDLIRDWRIGSVLLGSAAQRLVGTRKQALASLLIRGAAILSDQLTMTYSSVDFDEIKSSALNSREAIELLASFASEKEREEMKQQVAYLIDFVELYVLALPFRTVLNQLCDQCGDKVLIGPVSKALVVGKLAAVIQFSWLSDLDSKRGAKGLRESISNIPVAPFFRMMLAQHFLSRVYWAQWRPVDRSALLNAAADVVKGLGASLKKGELGRLIGQGASTGTDKRGK